MANKYVISGCFVNPIEPFTIKNNHLYDDFESAKQAASNYIHHDREIATTHPLDTDPTYEIIEKGFDDNRYVYALNAIDNDNHNRLCETVTVTPINAD